MRSYLSTLMISVLAVGCATTDSRPPATDQQGLAEIRVNAAPVLAASITHVTVEAAGESQDLTFTPATGTFDGAVILPSGTQSIVASAFSGDTLVGRSQPTTVEVATGVVTRVVLRILDLSPDPAPIYGPILDSLSYPTTTQVGASAVFALSVVAPAGDPVTYDWTSDCQDATFSAPQAATTSWSRPAQGTCTINVAATSSGFTVAQSFVIVVFPAGSASGAVDVSSTFVAAPVLVLMLPDLNCSIFPGSNASCPTTIASPTTTSYQASVVNWGASTPGTLELSDNCGGRFGTSSQMPGSATGAWLPPVAGGLCVLTARAVNGDGLAATISAAVLTRAGTQGTTQPPQIFANFDTGCMLQSASTPTECGPVPASRPLSIFGNVFWADGFPGALTITDDCALSQPQPDNLFAFHASWSLPNMVGRTCTTTVRATNLTGVSSEVAAHYQLFGP